MMTPTEVPVQTRFGTRCGPKRLIVVAGTVHPATVLQVEALVSDGWGHIAFDIGDPDGWPDEQEVLRAVSNCSTSGVVVSTHAKLAGHSQPDEVIDPSLVRNAVTLIDRIAPIVSTLLMDGRTGLVVTGERLHSTSSRGLV